MTPAEKVHLITSALESVGLRYDDNRRSIVIVDDRRHRGWLLVQRKQAAALIETIDAHLSRPE